jgi:Xaa-Pro dipeptidase
MSGEKSLEAIRIIKDSSEIMAMRKAVEIAQQALQHTLPIIKVGITERQLASELITQLLREGSEYPLPYAPIVSTGPNSANPHASPTNRPIISGDLLVIDYGATNKGYVSDITRTFAIGEVEPEFSKIARVVREANEAGRSAVRPGVTAEYVDQVTRQVIENAGFGRYFTHRTGHGLGLEGHEAPYIRARNPLILEQGMTFTIEPGIYLPNRGGVRIEDNVLVTEDGVESLTDLPRTLDFVG